MKNKILLICFLLFGARYMKAQEVATTSGGDASGIGGTAAYSVGQVMYTDVSISSGAVNQGVQQPYVVSITSGKINSNINLLVSVYPNPSTAFINLKVENIDYKNLSFQLFDVQGKLLINKKITGLETSITMDGFASGNYFLKVLSNDLELKTFKINKN